MMRWFLIVLVILGQGSVMAAPPDSMVYRVRLLKPALITGGLVAAGFLLDKTVQKGFAPRNGWDDVGNITDYGGEKVFVVPGLALTYGLSRFIIRDQKLQDVSMAAIKTVVVTAVFTEVIKYAAGRARPYTGEGAGSFHPFPGNREPYKSFPSGHTSHAFAVFTPFAEGYSRWLYVVPVAVGAGRIMQDKHWVSDVAFGGGIGFLAGYFFYHTGKRVVPIPNGLVLYF